MQISKSVLIEIVTLKSQIDANFRACQKKCWTINQNLCVLFNLKDYMALAHKYEKDFTGFESLMALIEITLIAFL